MSADTLVVAEYLVFQLGEEQYALPSQCLRAVTRYQAPLAVPGTPPELPGIISSSGSILAVVDPRPLLGLALSAPTRATRLLHVALDDLELALIVDGVFDLVTLPVAFGLPPSTLDPARARLLAGLASYAERPLALLDLAALVVLVREGS